MTELEPTVLHFPSRSEIGRKEAIESMPELKGVIRTVVEDLNLLLNTSDEALVDNVDSIPETAVKRAALITQMVKQAMVSTWEENNG